MGGSGGSRLDGMPVGVVDLIDLVDLGDLVSEVGWIQWMRQSGCGASTFSFLWYARLTLSVQTMWPATISLPPPVMQSTALPCLLALPDKNHPCVWSTLETLGDCAAGV